MASSPVKPCQQGAAFTLPLQPLLLLLVLSSSPTTSATTDTDSAWGDRSPLSSIATSGQLSGGVVVPFARRFLSGLSNQDAGDEGSVCTTAGDTAASKSGTCAPGLICVPPHNPSGDGGRTGVCRTPGSFGAPCFTSTANAGPSPFEFVGERSACKSGLTCTLFYPPLGSIQLSTSSEIGSNTPGGGNVQSKASQGDHQSAELMAQSPLSGTNSSATLGPSGYCLRVENLPKANTAGGSGTPGGMCRLGRSDQAYTSTCLVGLTCVVSCGQKAEMSGQAVFGVCSNTTSLAISLGVQESGPPPSPPPPSPTKSSANYRCEAKALTMLIALWLLLA